jgi:hypothetical protein
MSAVAARVAAWLASRLAWAVQGMALNWVFAGQVFTFGVDLRCWELMVGSPTG